MGGQDNYCIALSYYILVRNNKLQNFFNILGGRVLYQLTSNKNFYDAIKSIRPFVFQMFYSGTAKKKKIS